LLYSAFAALSIAVNIGAQIVTIELYRGLYAIGLSMAVGTGAGLITKYVLDKIFIFKHQTSGAAHEARTFGLYTLMGGVTTAVFWGTEYIFHLIFATDALRYLGGVIGLIIGYIIKYALDKRFVFR